MSPATLDVIECLPTMDAPTARSPLPVLARRSCTTGYEGLQNHYPMQEQGREERLNNYRGISLLIIVVKVFARVILIRLQKLAERIYPELQCGFRAERSTIDMVFSLRQLLEKCREQHKKYALVHRFF